MVARRCPQCGVDLSSGLEEIRCPWCGRVDWEALKGLVVGYATVSAGAYLLKRAFPKLEEKKPWLRKLLDLVK